jgi:hypothetical protein
MATSAALAVTKGAPMAYKLVEIRHVITDAPHIRRADLVTMTEAADLLGASISYVRNLLDLGKLRTVIDDESTTPHGTPKRYLIRDEVLAMQAEAGRA